MSFKRYMKKYINPTGTPKSDFYVTATTRALNQYMGELERVHAIPQLYVNGTTVIPGTPVYTIPIVNNPVGYWRNNHIRFTLGEVKKAMWCGDPSMTFINLFELIGRKIQLNFTRMTASAFIIGPDAPIVLNTEHFAAIGAAFIAHVKAENKTLDADRFLDLESEYICKAIKMILPAPTVLTGTCMGGTFTGTIGGNLGRAT